MAKILLLCNHKETFFSHSPIAANSSANTMNSETTVVNDGVPLENRDQPKQEARILDLPTMVIRRILYFVCTSSGSRSGSDGLKQTSNIGNLLNMLFTCKELYESYLYMAYTIDPLMLKDDRGHLLGMFRRKKMLGLDRLQLISTNEAMRNNIRVLNVMTTCSRMARYPRHEELDMAPLLRETFKLTEFDMILQRNLPRFKILHSLNLSGRNIKMISYLCHLPQNLKSISLFIDFKEHNFNNSEELEEMLSIIEKTEKHPTIENFQVYSDNPIMQTRIHSNLYLGKTKTPALYTDYFSTQVVARFEKLNFKRKRGLVLLGMIIYVLLDKFRHSLKSIELEKLDCALIFNSSIDSTIIRPLEYNFQFPRLRLLLVDSISSIKLNTWIKEFQDFNLSFRNEKPLFIAIRDELSGYLHTKTATQQQNHPNGRKEKWLHTKDPRRVLEKIKLDLEIH